MLLIDERPVPTTGRDALWALADLTLQITAATRRDDACRIACTGARRLLQAHACRLHRAGAGDDGGGTADHVLAAPLAAGGRALGTLVAERDLPFGAEDARLLRAVADHLAVALATADRVARLSQEHLGRELFDALAEGRTAAAEARMRAAGHDPDRPHVLVVLEPLGAGGGDPDGPGWAERAARVEARLRRAVPGALCDAGEERVRALLPLGGDAAATLARADAELDDLAREERLAAGRGEPRTGLAAGDRALAEAACAARVARAVAPDGGVRGYGELGVYRYLAQLPAGHAPDERHARAIATLAAYDARRRTDLVGTLERHLGDRGALAATARALYIHTNTLRQRLDRIEALTGLDLAGEDLLSLELALKLARLHPAS
jgi:hypothetical protein